MHTVSCRTMSDSFICGSWILQMWFVAHLYVDMTQTYRFLPHHEGRRVIRVDDVRAEWVHVLTVTVGIVRRHVNKTLCVCVCVCV